MKKLLFLLLGMITLGAAAQTTNMPSLPSAPFAYHLSSPDGAVYTSAQLSIEAFHKFCKLDSLHQVFPTYQQYRGQHSALNAIDLSVWNSSFTNESTNMPQECSFMLSQVDSLTAGSYTLRIEPNVHSVWGDLPVLSLKVNGGEWTNYSPFVDVNIGDTDTHLHVAVSYALNGEMRETGIELPVMRKSDLLVSNSPWPVNPGTSYEISAWYNSQEVKGNAYVRLSQDGVFDKPFIFVEGIDFGYDHSETRNGSFGWENFTRSNFSDGYQMLNDLPGMLDELYQHGYDVVLVDFYDGAADIHSNAALVQQVIRLSNEYKVGTEPNVVAGASMGGIVARVALREMELNQEAHCTRLYISVDAPHLGAYIPMALQSSIDFFSNFSGAADDFISNSLMRPAAQQLLIYQWFAPNREHPAAFTNFQNYLNQIGFPEKTRNIAIANGDAEVGLDYEAGSEMMDVHCNVTSLLPGDEFRCIMYPLPGSSNYVENTSANWVISDNKLTQVAISWSGIESASWSDAAVFATTAKPFDYANGGYSTSVKEFVNALNAASDFSGSCGQINQDQFKLRHCFVPTYSSLAMSDRTVFENVHNGTTPFADYILPVSGNEPHTKLTFYNLSFIAREVMGMEYSNGTSAWADAVSEHWNFNFGSTGVGQMACAALSDMVVSIGEIGISYNEQGGSVAAGNSITIELFSGCASSVLDMLDQSTLQIGSVSGEVNAELVVVDGTSIDLEIGSSLIVYPSGTLRIQSGGVLRLNGGTFNLMGKCLVEAGGRIEWNNGLWLINHTDAALIFEGGSLRVASSFNAELVVDAGGIHFAPDALSSIHILPSASLVVTGSGASSSIRIEANAHVIVDGGGQLFKTSNAQIQLAEGARWNSSVFTQLFTTTVEGSDGAKWDQSYSGLSATNATISQVALHVLKGKLNFNSVSVLANTHVVVSYGNMNVANSVFDHADLSSEFLVALAKIYQTSFSFATNAYADNSLVDVTVEQCTFSNNGIGIQKKGGKLNVRCSQFINHNQAVSLGKGTVLNMSSSSAGGYNYFSNSTEHIHFYHAGTPLLSKGYNVFTYASQYNMVGNIATLSCGLNCIAPSLNTTGNNFGNAGTGGMGVALFTSSMCNNGQVCPIGISPNSNYEFPCPVAITVLSPGKSMSHSAVGKTVDLPQVTTTEFGVLPLDSALSMAASKVFEWVDSTNNYKGALKALHEILVQPLNRMDPAVRKLSEWGMMQMKNNVEEMVMLNRAGLNGSNFDVTTQYYVDVLNAQTDSVLTDSTFRSQFWIELSKAQLFRTLNNPSMALYIMDRLNTCNLEGDELQELLYWKGLTQDELNLAVNAGLDLSNDSAYVAVTDDSFHFGVHIYTPHLVAFESCFNTVKENERSVALSVMPSRNNGTFDLVSNTNFSKVYIYDLSGRVVYETNGLFTNRMNIRVELEAGIYLVKAQLANNQMVTSKMEVVR